MRAVVQRVSEASVAVNGEYIAKINNGLLVLVGIKADDTEKDMDYIMHKMLGLRIFEDHEGKMNLSVKDIQGEVLVVPNFTVYGNAIKGMRPSFIASGSVKEAEFKYHAFINKLSGQEVPFATGKFQADMKVSLVNDGPVTILLDSGKVF
ncbi:D-aminoacyl-tRNA deacylase [Cellulosilyticum sp. I15G10I2]|uniref:D-aminoacyl-tRNA deacylase n=1 Tax=Cellulosilyticum sp. I15G10I2 TaxID=1892843 RepID=UPI00085C7F92|nr:D-aminoacyl-tRNA deacylase [Cellulosilyticum sp. I15G10I2]